MNEGPFDELNRVADMLANMTWGEFLYACWFFAVVVATDHWLEGIQP